MNETHASSLSSQIKVSLLTAKDKMYSILLPQTKEGRYFFYDSQQKRKLSFIYIEPHDNQWFVCATKNVLFSYSGFERSSQIPLEIKTFINIYQYDKKYTLYVEEVTEAEDSFHPFSIKENSEITIGRDPKCDIVFSNRLVSHQHCNILWNGITWSIEDLNSRNGIFLNSQKISATSTTPGSQVYIMGLRILLGYEFIYLNNIDKLTINEQKVVPINDINNIIFDNYAKVEREDSLFNRSPRKKAQIEGTTITFDSPPMQLSSNKLPLLLRLGSPMVMGGRALATGNIVSALTSAFIPLLTQGFSEKDRKEYEENRINKYNEYLAEKQNEIDEECNRELELLTYYYPTTAEIIEYPINQRSRLWERRNIDNDFLTIRVGKGDIPLLAEIEYSKQRFSLDIDPLEDQMLSIAAKKTFLHDAPITFSLIEHFVCGVQGTASNTLQFIRNLITQISILHSYDEVKIILLTSAEDLSKIDEVKYLPHFWDDEQVTRYIAISPNEIYSISNLLQQLVEKREEKNFDIQKNISDAPYYVLIALDKTIYDSIESIKSILALNKNIGISIVAAFEDIPKECSLVFELDTQTQPHMRFLRNDANDISYNPEEFRKHRARNALYQISNISLRNRQKKYTLPKALPFIDMFNVGKIEHLNPLQRWHDNNPCKSLAAEIGVSTDGLPFTLDLHEKKQGPHGLIAGMTGSGKSEFIITYILSLALNYHPYEVSFVLIDYKGGGLAGAFSDPNKGIKLPHLVGTITNLDGPGIQRALLSIESELHRRQRIFNKAKSDNNEGTMDIYAYQKLYRSGKVDEPISHLFIISDEFAELKQQQPEFMAQLISIARIGRSLGVHLILATQKPAGVVNDQILSNTKFRICLKVQDKADSMDMLKRPDAAELKDTGRFYLQVGYNEYFAMGQSAWSGAPYIPSETVKDEADNSIVFVDESGQPIQRCSLSRENNNSNAETQLVAIVKYLSALAEREGITTKPLWIDPLPEQLNLLDLTSIAPLPPAQDITAYVGLIDDPVHQSQHPLLVDVSKCHNILIVGESGCGKSVFLQSLLYDLVNHYTPDQINFYLVDMSNHGLSIYSKLSHCGAYITENDEEAFYRLLQFSRDILAERRKLFDQADVVSFEAYNETHSLPLLLFIIDNYANIMAFKNGSKLFSEMHEYLRDASSFGIKFIFTCKHLNEMSTRTKQEIDLRYALQLKDKFDYSEALGIRCSSLPNTKPGRGLCVYNKEPMEFQLAMYKPHMSEIERSRELKKIIQTIEEHNSGNSAVLRLPTINRDETYKEFIMGIENNRIPIGYSIEDCKKVILPYKQLSCISIYFGNPLGKRTIINNIITATSRDNAQYIVIRKKAQSIWGETYPDVPPKDNNWKFFECNEQESKSIAQCLINIVNSRKQYRNEYCEKNGLDPQLASSLKQAWQYINKQTKPVFVIFESYYDFCKNIDSEMVQVFTTLFDICQAYNIYFVACFAPSEAAAIKSEPIMNGFNKDQLILLTGGQYHLQGLTLLDLRRRNEKEIRNDYNYGVLIYRNEPHDIFMPCGTIDTNDMDPDDVSIF